MTEHELLRIITFLERVRSPFLALVPIAREDPVWNILLFLMKQHLTGAPVTISTLCSVSNVPYATAMRLVHSLIEDGQILKKPRGETGRSFILVPSEALTSSFIEYARRIKSLLADTFGLRAKTEDEESFYFGGSYFAAQIIPPPRLIEGLFRGRRELNFLLNDDNYFASMANMWADYRNNMSSRKNFHLKKLPELYAAILENGQLNPSRYDIVAINAPWLGESVKVGLFRPLDDFISTSAISPLDFHPSVWAMGSWHGQQYGVPIYCTIELLAARSDLFERDKYDYPTTFEETVEAARHFHKPARERFGIAWNGGCGMPVASTFMFLMSCCGESILSIPKSGSFFTVDSAHGEQLRPRILSEAGLHVLDYLHQLIPYSPPSILDMDWDKRTMVFLEGHAAMAYCWTVRAARFETDINSAVRRKVAYLQQPRGPGGASANPIGGFLLCVPRNISDERAELAFQAIAWMTSPEAMKASVKNGFPVAPRFSVGADPEAANTSPIVTVVDRLARRNLLKSWPRPPVPEYRQLEAIIGNEIHRALTGEVSDHEALSRAQSQADRVMHEAGYY
jgi:multiple sugar transport system substrate-binding protein